SLAAFRMSALPPKADITENRRHVRYVPSTDSCSAANRLYSITSSARASSEGGMLRPRALAVLALITNSYLVGACTGRLAGFSPLTMQSTKPAPPRTPSPTPHQ